MSELAVVDKSTDWRRLKSLVLDFVSSPITERVYDLALAQCQIENSSVLTDWHASEDRTIVGDLFLFVALNPLEAQLVETNQRLRTILLATAMTSIRIGVLSAANEQLRSSEPVTQRAVNVYLENIPEMRWTVERAKAITTDIFSTIGVKVIWVDLHHELMASQDGTIIVKFSTATPIDFRPRALAQSFPYEGTRAEVFYDRVRQRVIPSLVPVLLGHVLSHEIGHLLEGTDAHSDRGIMKACWDRSDYDRMVRELLTFTDLDIRTIYAGLDARSRRAAERFRSAPD